MPQSRYRWILSEEMLPEKDGHYYLVTFRVKNKDRSDSRIVLISRFDKRRKTFCPVDEPYPRFADPIAWMPMPEPYDGEAE